LNRKKKKKKTHVPVRMNLLFFAVFLLFSLLVLRLGVVQIVNGQSYQKEVERTEDVVVDTGVPRGKIYDRYGNVIVDNVPLNAITYTRTQSTKTEEMIDVATKLAELIEKDTKSVTERDKKDFWILKNPEKAKEKVSEKEAKKIQSNEDLSEDEANAEIYKLQLERITKEELNSLTKQQLEVLAIYREFSSGYALTPQIVKNEGVTSKEFAVVSEHLDELPGVNTTTDWERSYVFDDTLRTILGSVSSSREGLPKGMVDQYLAKDYSRNDRVGTSYVEYQYEDILQGHKEKIKNITKDGSVLESKLIQEGQRGKDVVLSIDMELQKEVEKIVKEELQKHINTKESPYLDRAFVVMMDPYTGEIKAMVGKKYAKNPNTGKYEFQDYALGTFTSSYEVGSAVKGATVLTGYMTNVLTPGENIVDEPIYIKGTPKKTSWFNVYGQRTGPISDLYALEISSNSYMWKVAMRIAGARYVPHQPLDFDPDAFDKIRQHFAQFGLGVPTGIDLPGEVAGFQGKDKRPGLLLDLAIGQYDTFTPMQLVQYVSTIANGGYRIQPHVLKEVRNPVSGNDNLGKIIYEKEAKVLNRIGATQEQIEHVQKGFYRVTHGADGTANNFKDAPYNAAGKSGTAESFYKGPNMEEADQTYNTTLIGYAPFNNPEIAFSTVVPWSHQNHDPYINKTISKRVMDKYFELKKNRAEKGLDKSDVTKKVENAEDVEELQEEVRQENQ
jgi:cell division protein FtsI/penicillin-binding protein 2